jgi:hypothetical protein
MKGISNRQKMIVKPRGSVQKHVSQMRDLQKAMVQEKGRSVSKGGFRRTKP